MPNFTFRKEERLGSRKEILQLVRNGRRISGKGFHLSYLFFNKDREPRAKVVFSVSKKKFKRAVDRNLIKRRMREAYRLNKNKLIEHLKSSNKSLNIMFIYNEEKVMSYEEIENKLVLLLDGLQAK